MPNKLIERTESMFKNNAIKNFLELTRAYSLPASIAPYFVALCWGFFMEPKLLHIILSFVAIVCLHLGSNLYDDFIDVTMRLQKGEKLSEISFCKGKCKAKLIIEEFFSLDRVRAIIFTLFLTAVIIGIYFYTIYGISVIKIAVFGGILCLLYPLSSKVYLSEIIIGILFGILLPMGVFLVLTGYGSLSLFHFSLSLALLIVALAHAHAIMDWEYDERNDKRTLARLCGTKKNALILLGVMIFIAFLNLGALISLYYVPTAMALAFITIPIAIELIESMDDYIKVVDVEFKPRWWMGIMENWDKIKEEGRAYFMYRFYLARNLALYFALIAGLAFYFSVSF